MDDPDTASRSHPDAGWDEERRQADAEIDALCITCGYWEATNGDQCEACSSREDCPPQPS